MMAALSPPLNCSLALLPTPAPSRICLKEEEATVSPSCPGGGLLYVGEEMASPTLTRAYPGLQETQHGLLSSP